MFAEILGVLAQALGEPGIPRASWLLRLTSADAALLGLRELSTQLNSLSIRIEQLNGRAQAEPVVAQAVGTLARSIIRVENSGDRELQSLAAVLGAWDPVPSAEPEPGPHDNPGGADPLSQPDSPEFGMVELPREAPPQIYLEEAEDSDLQSHGRGHALVLDPAPVTRALLARLLRKLSWEVTEFTWIGAALDAISRGEGLVLFVDVRHLKTRPRDVADEVRNRTGGRGLPMVFLVDPSVPEEAEAAREAGARALLQRPAEESELRNILENLTGPGGQA